MEDLITHLYGLADGTIKPHNANYGLCKELRYRHPSYLKLVRRYFRNWPLYSGNWFTPVPHPVMECTDAYEELDDLWADDEYGDNRRDLCRFCAQELEKLLKGESDENKS